MLQNFPQPFDRTYDCYGWSNVRLDVDSTDRSTQRSSESPESTPAFGLSLWKKRLFYFSIRNLNWNWNRNWDGSWNDLRECQKLWGGLCILYRTYTGGEAPPITTNCQYKMHEPPQSFWHSLKSFQLQSQSQFKFKCQNQKWKRFFIYHRRI